MFVKRESAFRAEEPTEERYLDNKKRTDDLIRKRLECQKEKDGKGIKMFDDFSYSKEREVLLNQLNTLVDKVNQGCNIEVQCMAIDTMLSVINHLHGISGYKD